MKEFGTGEKGAELQRWTDWLALDLSADITYSREMGQMRDSKYVELRYSFVDLLIRSSEGLGTPQRSFEAELVCDDEPDYEEVPPSQPPYVPYDPTISVVFYAQTHQDEHGRCQDAYRESRQDRASGLF